MKWDKAGAIKALDAKECIVCEKFKPVYVVVTVHGKKDLHLPCCSSECAETLAEIYSSVMAEK